jgi:Uma2 family endonuclease
MMKAKRLQTDRRMTLREWGDLPEDVYAELVDGVLVDDEVTTEQHDAIATHLATRFAVHFEHRGGVVFMERKFGVGRRTGRKPDVSVFLPGTKGLTGDARVTMAAPDVAIEIVTPTLRDVRRDRVEKRREYAKFGIRWYWIVDPELQTVEILGLARNGRYEHVTDASSGKLRVPGCRGLVIDVDALWRLPVPRLRAVK